MSSSSLTDSGAEVTENRRFWWQILVFLMVAETPRLAPDVQRSGGHRVTFVSARRTMCKLLHVFPPLALGLEPSLVRAG